MLMAKTVYCCYSTTLEVPFFDVDSMHIVWHGHYVKYLELARCAFLDAVGYNYRTMGEYGLAWPVVQMQIKYVKPARFGQKIRVKVNLVEYESCLKLDYVIDDCLSGACLTRAQTTQVVVRLDNGEMQLQTPPSWLRAIQRYMAKSALESHNKEH